MCVCVCVSVSTCVNIYGIVYIKCICYMIEDFNKRAQIVNHATHCL